MNIDLLKRLCETPGVPGREERVRALIEEEIEGLFDSVEVDALGSLICRRSPRGGKGTRKAILVVDDDADIRQTLEMTLQYEGFEVWTAKSGTEALARLEADARAREGAHVLRGSLGLLGAPGLSGLSWAFIEIGRYRGYLEDSAINRFGRVSTCSDPAAAARKPQTEF